MMSVKRTTKQLEKAIANKIISRKLEDIGLDLGVNIESSFMSMVNTIGLLHLLLKISNKQKNFSIR